MTEKRFVDIGVEWIDGFIRDHKDDKDLFSIKAVVDCLNEQHEQIQEQKRQIRGLILLKNGLIDDCKKLSDEYEQLKQQLSDIEGQLVMFDQCDNWDYDRVMYTVRHIAEIMGYTGGI